MNKKAKALRGLGKEQMSEKLKELRKELLKMNSQIAVGTAPESPGKVKQVKKEIARILTVLNEPLKVKTEEKAASVPKGAAAKKKQEVSKSQ